MSWTHALSHLTIIIYGRNQKIGGEALYDNTSVQHIATALELRLKITMRLAFTNLKLRAADARLAHSISTDESLVDMY